MKSLDLGDLPVGAPLLIAVSHLSEMGLIGGVETLLPIEARGELMRQCLDLRDAAAPRRRDRLLIQLHCIDRAILEAGHLGRVQ